MKDVTLKLWDSSPQSTDNFSLITKFTDLGEPTSRKSILGFYINYFFSNKFTTGTAHSFPTNIEYKLAYRTDLSQSFTNIITHSNNMENSQLSNFSVIHDITPIKVDNIQFKIYSYNIQTNDFGINDFGIKFRVHRTMPTKEFDED
tara:strand:+ start:31 stop:468 length:438 start_codon:yes stop_codon:yes gene_type:complete